MKKRLSTIVFILVFSVGLLFLLYPTVSNYINSFHASEAITKYRAATGSLSEEECNKMLQMAEQYNSELALGNQHYELSDEERKTYEDLLNPNGDGMMGYIEIPSINVELPVYHGTGEAVLQTATGHLEWTSLPVGGLNTHCVVSGHRGLPRAKLFSDLNKLAVGDTFSFTVLNRTISYEVDKIETVEPDEVDGLMIQQEKDLCTLFTCTPYGINTHRLLVFGHRVDKATNPLHISSEAAQIDPLMVMPFVAAPLLLIAFALVRQIDRRTRWDEESFPL